jgi:hypothetical protein
MKNGVLWAIITAFVCVATPGRAYAGVPQWRQAPVRHASVVRQAPKRPKRDQLQRNNMEGAITLIQLITTRRSHHESHNQDVAPSNSAAQVRASSRAAEYPTLRFRAIRPVELLPPHWGSTHICV